MRNTRILISGGSVAGPALAYWLRRYGFEPTIVERAPAPRPGGQAIDVRGVALTVAERMGVLDRIRLAATAMRGMSVVDTTGAELMRTTEETLTGGPIQNEDVEIMRDDLTALLYELTDGVEILFGDSIASLDEDADGVSVVFDSGLSRRFDLVVGADGQHSRVRDLAFGPEEEFVRHLNTYLCIFSLDNFLDLDHWQTYFHGEKEMIGVYSARQNREARAMLGYESEPFAFDHRDVDAQRRIIADRFADSGWETPRLLKAMWQADDFYFDSMVQIRMDAWSRGRTTLVGDAGYCGSPLSGQGTSMALVGAYVLAGELAAADGDHERAFAAYERELRPYVQGNQDLGLLAAEAKRPVEPERLAEIANGLTLKTY